MRITDPAIIAAATLSDRYIADRFLPDTKAIDLIDEAAARQRMQVDSKPEELDEFDRRIMQLKIEQEALKKETDTASKDRLKKLAGELAELQEKSDALTARWRAEKDKYWPGRCRLQGRALRPRATRSPRARSAKATTRKLAGSLTTRSPRLRRGSRRRRARATACSSMRR